VHFVVVHLDVTGQIRATALIDAVFFLELSVFHLELADMIPQIGHLSLLFFHHAVGGANFLADCGIVALHSTL